jgi:hypothetical protein
LWCWKESANECNSEARKFTFARLAHGIAAFDNIRHRTLNKNPTIGAIARPTLEVNENVVGINCRVGVNEHFVSPFSLLPMI